MCAAADPRSDQRHHQLVENCRKIRRRMVQPRRFDTRFFVAMRAPGQSAGVLTTESDHGGWVTIQRALADVRGGTWR